jgi:preprotein translocase subunit SecD
MVKSAVVFCAILIFSVYAIAKDMAPVILKMVPSIGEDLDFGTHNILEVSSTKDADEEIYSVLVRVDETMEKAFTRMTLQNVSRSVNVKICGQTVVTPTIKSPMYGGIFIINGSEENKVKEWVEKLTGVSECE